MEATWREPVVLKMTSTASTASRCKLGKVLYFSIVVSTKVSSILVCYIILSFAITLKARVLERPVLSCSPANIIFVNVWEKECVKIVNLLTFMLCKVISTCFINLLLILGVLFVPYVKYEW